MLISRLWYQDVGKKDVYIRMLISRCWYHDANIKLMLALLLALLLLLLLIVVWWCGSWWCGSWCVDHWCFGRWCWLVCCWWWCGAALGGVVLVGLVLVDDVGLLWSPIPHVFREFVSADNFFLGVRRPGRDQIWSNKPVVLSQNRVPRRFWRLLGLPFRPESRQKLIV